MIKILDKDNKEIISARINPVIKVYQGVTHINVDTLVKPILRIEGVEYQSPVTLNEEELNVLQSKRYRNNKFRRSYTNRSH